MEHFNDKEKIEFYKTAFRFNDQFKALNDDKERQHLSDIYSLNLSITQWHNSQSLEKNLSLLSSIGQYLSTHSLTESMLRFNQDLNSFMRADIFAIGLCDQNNNHFLYEHYFENGKSIAPPVIDLTKNSSIAGYCLKKQKAFIHNDFSIDVMSTLLSIPTEELSVFGNSYDFSSSVMFAPIIFEEKVLGVLTVQSKASNSYNDYQFNILKHLTTYLAIGIMHIRQKNALLQQREEFKKLSLTDALTGLYNRKALFDHFNQITSIDHCGILVIDIDYFKEYNDFYGHLAGDQLLKDFSILLKETIEDKQGIAARYGGDEFILFIHNCTQTELLSIGHRLLDKVRNAKLKHSQSKVSEFITLSIGASISKFTPNISIDSIIYPADLALYKAKNNGRDQLALHHK